MKRLLIAATLLLASPAHAITSYAVSIVDIGTAAQNGYVSRTLGGNGQLVQTTEAAQALRVQQPNQGSSTVLLTNVAGTSRTALGAVDPAEIVLQLLPSGAGQAAAFTPASLSPTTFDYLNLAATDSTNAGDAPGLLGNSITDSDGIPRVGASAIWTLDVTSRLVPSWVNPDGTRPATSVMLDEDGLFLTGNPGGFTDESGAREVQLVLVDPQGPGEPAPVPEPATLALLAAGLGSAALARRRAQA